MVQICQDIFWKVYQHIEVINEEKFCDRNYHPMMNNVDDDVQLLVP